jgi:hypothetical protein
MAFNRWLLNGGSYLLNPESLKGKCLNVKSYFLSLLDFLVPYDRLDCCIRVVNQQLVNSFQRHFSLVLRSNLIQSALILSSLVFHCLHLLTRTFGGRFIIFDLGFSSILLATPSLDWLLLHVVQILQIAKLDLFCIRYALRQRQVVLPFLLSFPVKVSSVHGLIIQLVVVIILRREVKLHILADEVYIHCVSHRILLALVCRHVLHHVLLHSLGDPKGVYFLWLFVMSIGNVKSVPLLLKVEVLNIHTSSG